MKHKIAVLFLALVLLLPLGASTFVAAQSEVSTSLEASLEDSGATAPAQSYGVRSKLRAGTVS